MSNLDLAFVRSQFPGLERAEVLFDNAGGTLALGRVADRVRDHLLHHAVQLGASYEGSRLASERYQTARQRLAAFLGASRPEEVVFGSSSTALLQLLARASTSRIGPGDAVVVTRADHEANIGCWLALARQRGVEVRFWDLDPDSGLLEPAGLARVLDRHTRLVACTHVSNLLGAIHPLAAITELAHRHGAQVCVDGVAHAPHRPLELAATGVDYYVFSLYKVFGPHHAVLYGRHDRLLELDNVNHGFFVRDQVPAKLEPGNANYELSHGAAGIVDYFEELGRRHAPQADDATARQVAWDRIAAHEEQLAAPLLAFLRDRPAVHIHGPATADRDRRVPTISFTHQRLSAAEIVAAIDAHRIGIRFGHFYAPRLVKALGLDPRDGVVRVSMVHYNTVEEVDRLIHHLAAIL